MKKMTSAILGLSLTLATAGLTFAAQDAKPADANGNAPTTTTAKKHAKKHNKKAANQTAAPSATQNQAK
jgi:hypothetical protein